MPSEPAPSLPDDFGSLRRGRYHYFPVVPGKMEFAIAVREAILRERPEVVAVELPATLEDAYLWAVRRLPQISVIFYADEAPSSGEDDQAIYIPIEPCDPFTEALRTAMEVGARIEFIDPDLGERPHLPDTYPDTYALRHIAVEKYVEAYRVYPQPRSEQLDGHADGIAWKLQGADPMARVMVIISLNLVDPVLDAMERPQAQPMVRRREGIQLVNPHPGCLAEVTLEYPFLQARYEEFRGEMAAGKLIDRRHVQLAVFRESEKSYEKNAGERVAHWQRRLLARFTRNLALTSHALTASLYDLTVAARSVVDDNYAWEVWETAAQYPHQKEISDAPTMHISGEEVWVDTRKIRLRRRLPSAKRRLRPVGLKARKKEKYPGEWAEQLDGNRPRH
jgi:hypothetical protein